MFFKVSKKDLCETGKKMLVDLTMQIQYGLEFFAFLSMISCGNPKNP